MTFNKNGDKIGFTSNHTVDGAERVLDYADKTLKDDKIKETIIVLDKKYLGGFR